MSRRKSSLGMVLGTVLSVAVTGAAWGQETKPAPTDPEIAHIAVTANQVDADLAKFALTKTQNAEVRRFAQTMVTDHESVIKQATELATKLKVTPKEHEVSRSLKAGGEEAKKKLEGLSGAAFDRAYMEREVAYHQAVIDAVRSTLIPNAKNAELKGLLEKVMPVLEGHLRHAKELQAKLGH